MTELKTLREVNEELSNEDQELFSCNQEDANKNEAIKIFKNLQSPDTIYPIVLENFPDSAKGEIAKDKWNETTFRYGAEYGMLAMLFWFFNLKEEDLK